VPINEESTDILELVFRNGTESSEPSSIEAIVSDLGDPETDMVAEMPYAWLFHPCVTVPGAKAVGLSVVGIWL
jgi:hypothetical protein